MLLTAIGFHGEKRHIGRWPLQGENDSDCAGSDYPNRVSTYSSALSGGSFTIPGPLRTKKSKVVLLRWTVRGQS